MSNSVFEPEVAEAHGFRRAMQVAADICAYLEHFFKLTESAYLISGFPM